MNLLLNSNPNGNHGIGFGKGNLSTTRSWSGSLLLLLGISPPPPEASDFEGYFQANLLTADFEGLLFETMQELVANKTLPTEDSVAWYNARILAARDVYSEACQNITGGVSAFGVHLLYYLIFFFLPCSCSLSTAYTM